jgi:hypothetical protein
VIPYGWVFARWVNWRAELSLFLHSSPAPSR